jgi:hypothetical protein
MAALLRVRLWRERARFSSEFSVLGTAGLWSQEPKTVSRLDG